MVEVKVAWARVWLDLCTNQVVSARACAYHFLTSNSAVINLLGKRTVQADGCLHSEQIDTLFVSVGGQEGGVGGGGVILGWRPRIYTWLSGNVFRCTHVWAGLSRMYTPFMTVNNPSKYTVFPPNTYNFGQPYICVVLANPTNMWWVRV